MITLQPNESLPITLGKTWLNVYSLSGVVRFVSVSGGIDQIIRSAKSYNVEGLQQAQLKNPSSTSAITIDFDNEDLQTASTSVDVANAVVVQRIVEAIQVNANATVDNGKMQKLVANNRADIAVLTIPAGQTKKFVAARDAGNRKVNISVVSDAESAPSVIALSNLRIGGDNTLSASKGDVLRGSIRAVGYWSDETTGDIYIHNAGSHDAKVCGSEVWRAS